MKKSAKRIWEKNSSNELGPAVGVMFADMVTRARTPTSGLERSLFRYARFAENQPVCGKYEYSVVG